MRITRTKLTGTLLVLIALNASAQFKIKKPDLSGGKSDKVETPPGSKAQPYIDGAKASISKLDDKLSSANWSNGGFETGYTSELENLASKIKSIKRDDPNYKVSEFEDKYNYFVTKKDEGLKQVNDDKTSNKNKKEEEAKKVEKAKFDEIHKKIKDEGITNATHEKYKQKIVFSTAEISKTTPNEGAFAHDFQITNPIYFRVYLKECIYNTHVISEYDPYIIGAQGGLWCKIYLDGKLIRDGNFSLKSEGGVYVKPEDKKTLTTLSGIFNFKDENLGSYEYIYTLIENEKNLTPGKHSYKLELYPRHMADKGPTNELLASGEFNLNVIKGFVDPTNYVVCMPTSKKKDPALETKFLGHLKDYYVSNEEKVAVKKFVLRSSDWEVTKNDITGKIMYRRMFGSAGITTSEGKCEYREYAFTQEWNGSSFQSKPEVSSTGNQGDVFCDCLK